MSSAIAVKSLTKLYGEQKAVDGVTFEVPWGRVTGFLGPNGAGKTTTMRMVLGLVTPSSGSSEVADHTYRQLAHPSRTVGALLETQQFHPSRSARNHLRVCAAAGGIPDRRVDEVLDAVDLTQAARKKTGEFSLGMRQRLGIAGALLGKPPVLILDEPSNGLDPAGIRWLRSILRDHAAEGGAVFVSSHLLAEMAHIADEVVVINDGRFLVHAAVTELVSHAERGIKVRTEEPERLRDLMTSQGKVAELTSHDVVLIRGASVEEVGRAAAQARIPLFALDPDVGTLEDVFFELTRSEAHV